MTGEWSFVWAAYALTWATLLAYAWYLVGRAREAERELVEPIDPRAVYRGGDDGIMEEPGVRAHEENGA